MTTLWLHSGRLPVGPAQWWRSAIRYGASVLGRRGKYQSSRQGEKSAQVKDFGAVPVCGGIRPLAYQRSATGTVEPPIPCGSR